MPAIRFRAARRVVAVVAGTVLVAAMPALADSGSEQRSFARPADDSRGNAYSGTSLAEFERFQRKVLDHVSRYWRDVFAKNGAGYRSPSVVFTPPGKVNRSVCGYSADPDDFPRLEASPAFYCPSGETVYLSTGWLYREVYDRYGDFAAAAVAAHEVAHHVQYLLGVVDESGGACCGKSAPQVELEADCLSGTWANAAHREGLLEAGDVDEAKAGSYAAGDPARTTHGTPRERRDWFEHGFETGQPRQCRPPR